MSYPTKNKCFIKFFDPLDNVDISPNIRRSPLEENPSPHRIGHF